MTPDVPITNPIRPMAKMGLAVEGNCSGSAGAAGAG